MAKRYKRSRVGASTGYTREKMPGHGMEVNYLTWKACWILTSLGCIATENSSGLETETKHQKHQLPCMEILRVLKIWCRHDYVLVLSRLKIQKQQLSIVMFF